MPIRMCNTCWIKSNHQVDRCLYPKQKFPRNMGIWLYFWIPKATALPCTAFRKNKEDCSKPFSRGEAESSEQKITEQGAGSKEERGAKSKPLKRNKKGRVVTRP